MTFPIDFSKYQPVQLSLQQTALTAQQQQQLQTNIALVRASIIFFTANANTKGLGGHTGGAYDMAPEVLLAEAFIAGGAPVYPVFFDEAGHRVAMQYMLAALKGFISFEQLLHYREYDSGLYGHPERNDAGGIFFSSGRLGHLWSYVNGVARAFPDQAILLFGSDGSQQEGGGAEAARSAVAQGLNVKLIIDDNDVTIAGHPSVYMPGFDVATTLQGHGLRVDQGDGEDLTTLFARLRQALLTPGPVALVNRRKMAPGVPGIEGSPQGHDVIPVDLAVAWLTERQQTAAVAHLQAPRPSGSAPVYDGSSTRFYKNRDDFGKYICDRLATLPNPAERVLVVDSDLEGSCGLHHIRKKFPEVYIHGGIMERNNFSMAAGFGASPQRQGIFGTFSAFMEMLISEISMARLNRANVLAHFSHSGVDDMADNTCHFGINNFFADNGLPEHDTTRLYYPADTHQLKALLQAIFDDAGLRFVFSTRSATPLILNEAGEPFFANGYQFVPGQDDLVRPGGRGYIVTYGEMLYRCLDVVAHFKTCQQEIGLVNKATLNVVDEAMLERLGAADFVLVVESQNIKTGLGSRLGTWLLTRGYHPRYAIMGSQREGKGGLVEQIPCQGLGREAIIAQIEALV